MIRSGKSGLARVLQYVALFCYIVFLGFPVLWLLSMAFKTVGEIKSPNPTFLPASLYWQNFVDGIERTNLFTAGLNSLIVAVSTTVLVTILALPAAYALARFETKLRGIATGWILLSQVFPFILIVIPLFLILKQAALINTLPGLIIVYTIWALPFALWMLRGYIASIPSELEEAGAIDGAGRIRVLWAIMLPLLGPGLVATSLFAFIESWNEFFFALVIIKDQNLATIPLVLARFVGSEGLVQIGPLAAASVMAMIPSLVFFALIQRRLMSGLMGGAIKG